MVVLVWTIVTGGQAGPLQDGGLGMEAAGGRMDVPGLMNVTVVVGALLTDTVPGIDATGVGFPATGQIVVYKGMVTVVREPYGQFVTDAGHFVTVPVDVV
jgi:hypothetical protein